MALLAIIDRTPSSALSGSGWTVMGRFDSFGGGQTMVGTMVSGSEIPLPGACDSKVRDKGRDLGGSRRLKRGLRDRFCPVRFRKPKPGRSVSVPRATELPLSCAFLRCLPASPPQAF